MTKNNKKFVFSTSNSQYQTQIGYITSQQVVVVVVVFRQKHSTAPCGYGKHPGPCFPLLTKWIVFPFLIQQTTNGICLFICQIWQSTNGLCSLHNQFFNFNGWAILLHILNLNTCSPILTLRLDLPLNNFQFVHFY